MEKAEYTQKISELISKIGKLQREKKALEDSYAKEVLEKYGYHIGGRIKDPYGDEYEITRAEPVGHRLCLWGKKIKKDGTPTVREVSLYRVSLELL